MAGKTNTKQKRIGGQKKALTKRDVQSIENRLHTREDWRGLAIFRTAIDSMLRASDLVRLDLDDVVDRNGDIRTECEIIMKKTKKRVKFRLADHTRQALKLWIDTRPPFSGEWLFPGKGAEGHISEVHYRRMAKEWFDAAGLDVRDFSTHSLRRTKAAEMYRQTKNIKAISLRLGHSNPSVTAEYLGIDDADSLDLSDKVKI